MSQYKVTLHLSEQELTILYNALHSYTLLGEETSVESQNLLEKLVDLYIEEDRSSDAARAFIDQFGIDELLENRDKWEGFLNAYCNRTHADNTHG